MVVMPDGKYDFKPYAIGYQKDSPYREILDFHINMMRETGTLENIVSSYRGQPQECPDFRCRKIEINVNSFQIFIMLHFQWEPPALGDCLYSIWSSHVWCIFVCVFVHN